jgi:hypothetical protein
MTQVGTDVTALTLTGDRAEVLFSQTDSASPFCAFKSPLADRAVGPLVYVAVGAGQSFLNEIAMS